MPPTEKQKKEVSIYVKKWRLKLFLTDWHFTSVYPHELEAGDGSAASVKMQVEYKEACLKVNPLFWDEPKEKREMIIAHELCHCIVQPLVQLACDAGDGHAVSGREIDHWKEYVTQHITNAVFYG